ncbi:hypothetical protein EXIGLDRAFT_764302 [Exidia glandulosa HHB12029]|uniref:Extracellular membrane protein CFEM domain-containing protein n=1 Tax=Exidia glandulosa HHB12029 TaxID=1314781 RepID=A0A165L8E7_EXIGL|nr:hypothetical protein EXIGLDRAFT_764302 [Exidia glandulosa HHB12029]
MRLTLNLALTISFIALVRGQNSTNTTADGNPICVDTCLNTTIAGLSASTNCSGLGENGTGFPQCLCPSNVQNTLQTCFNTTCSADESLFGHDITASGCAAAEPPADDTGNSGSTKLAAALFSSAVLLASSMASLL